MFGGTFLAVGLFPGIEEGALIGLEDGLIEGRPDIRILLTVLVGKSIGIPAVILNFRYSVTAYL